MRPFCVPCKEQARQSLAGCGQGARHNILAPALKWRCLLLRLAAILTVDEIHRGQCPATLPLRVQKRQHCKNRLPFKGPRSQGDAHRGLPGENLRHQMFKLWLDCWGAKTVQRLATTILPQQLVYLRAGDTNDTAVRRGQANDTGGR